MAGSSSGNNLLALKNVPLLLHRVWDAPSRDKRNGRKYDITRVKLTNTQRYIFQFSILNHMRKRNGCFIFLSLWIKS